MLKTQLDSSRTPKLELGLLAVMGSICIAIRKPCYGKETDEILWGQKRYRSYLSKKTRARKRGITVQEKSID